MTTSSPVKSRAVLRLIPLAAVLTLGTSCDYVQALLAGGGPEVVEEANSTLKDGDLPGAAAQYEELASAHADSVHVAIGRAYTQLLAGDTAGADATLAAAEEGAGEMLGEVKLRRALVALEAKDVESVKTHGLASGLPEGKLLAAEVHIIDLESDEAAAIFRELASEGGAVGEAASQYVAMLDGDQIQAGLAEAAALWALGDRKAGCETAEDLLKALPEDDDTKASQILLWAGRSATSGVPAIAASLLDELAFPPEGQAWRVQATRAIVAAAQGEADEAIRILDALDAGCAPADGVADARATACALVGDKPKARQLVGELESPAVARCLSEVGANAVAPTRAPDGPLKTYLESQQ